MNPQTSKLKTKTTLRKPLFEHNSEREIINYLYNKVQELEMKIEANENNIQEGFLTIPKPVAELWDNTEEDEWSKHI